MLGGERKDIARREHIWPREGWRRALQKAPAATSRRLQLRRARLRAGQQCRTRRHVEDETGHRALRSGRERESRPQPRRRRSDRAAILA